MKDYNTNTYIEDVEVQQMYQLDVISLQSLRKMKKSVARGTLEDGRAYEGDCARGGEWSGVSTKDAR